MAEPRLYLRGRVYWTWFLDAEGVRHQVSTKCRDRRAARDRALELERTVAAAGGRAPKDRLTLRRALALAIERQVRRGRAPSTVQTAGYHSAHLLGFLGDVPVDGLTAARVAAYVTARRAERASKHTCKKEVAFLVQALSGAAAQDLWRPAKDPRLLTPEELRSGVYRPRRRWLTRDEYARLAAQLSPDRQDYLAAWCYLGVRKTELFTVQPGDFDGRRLRVRGTKTEGSDRQVPVPEAVRGMLERRCGKQVPFPAWPHARDSLNQACARAGISPVSPNDLRRTFASWLVQAGVPERTIAELLGHTKTNLVRSVYGHLDAEALAAAVAKL